MAKKRLLTNLAVFFLWFGCGVGIAWAQDLPVTTAIPGLMSDQEIHALSSAERSGQVASAIEGMKGVLARGLKMLEKTRNEERDVLKLNCINEKLSSIKGFLKVGERAAMAQGEASSRGDSADEVHQMKLVMLAAARVQALAEEMEACAGEVVQYSGPTRLDLEVDETVRTDSPVDIDTGDVPLWPLPDVSPFQ